MYRKAFKPSILMTRVRRAMRAPRPAAVVGGTALTAVKLKRDTAKRRTAYKYRKPGKLRMPMKKSAALASRVNMLTKKLGLRESRLEYRAIDAYAIRPSQNATNYNDYIINDTTFIEAALASVPYFNPATPGTVTNVNLASPSFSQKIRFKGYTSILLKNNYQIPCEIHVYKMTVKVDTNIPPVTAFSNGLSDVGSPSSTSLCVFPSDSRQLGVLWRTDKTFTAVLKPGETRKYFISCPEILYDPSTTDSQSLSYQRNNKCAGFLVRVSGTPSHDSTTTTQYGVSPAGVDVLVKRYATIIYDSGGASLDNIIVSDSLDTQTASAVVSQLVADNQAYSIS